MAHLNSSFRYVITYLFCYAMGYHGYGDVVKPFNAGIALNAAFLLGSVPGSALAGNMKKFQGIVLGTAGGQLVFPLTHAAAGLGPAVIGVALFVYIFVTSLIKFGSAEWGAHRYAAWRVWLGADARSHGRLSQRSGCAERAGG